MKQSNALKVKSRLPKSNYTLNDFKSQFNSFFFFYRQLICVWKGFMRFFVGDRRWDKMKSEKKWWYNKFETVLSRNYMGKNIRASNCFTKRFPARNYRQWFDEVSNPLNSVVGRWKLLEDRVKQQIKEMKRWIGWLNTEVVVLARIHRLWCHQLHHYVIQLNSCNFE